jgi:glycosyltransferase involved in cell wall biosynthesis
MRVLVHSNAPWVPSGYGSQCALLTEQMKRDHEVAVSAFFGLHGAALDWNDMVIFPGGANPYGNDVLIPHAEFFFEGARGLILTLLDVWVLNAQSLRDYPVASWIPLDHLHMQPVIKQYLKQSEAIPIAMSKFGKKQLEDNDFECHYAPHGVDTTIFKPMDREECQESLVNFPKDAFVAGIVAANQGTPSRKCFAESFMAMARIMEKHNDVFLYLHTDTGGQRGQGVHMKSLSEAVGIPSDRIIACDQYQYQNGGLSAEHLARVYNSVNVLLNPSMGEGFGVPIVEAQACGTPVIATNSTAMSELVGAGWLVEGQEFYTNLGEFQMLPDVGELTASIFSAMDRADDLRESARDFALKYDIVNVYEKHWQPVIEEVGEKVRSKQVMEITPIS